MKVDQYIDIIANNLKLFYNTSGKYCKRRLFLEKKEEL